MIILKANHVFTAYLKFWVSVAALKHYNYLHFLMTDLTIKIPFFTTWDWTPRYSIFTFSSKFVPAQSFASASISPDHDNWNTNRYELFCYLTFSPSSTEYSRRIELYYKLKIYSVKLFSRSTHKSTTMKNWEKHCRKNTKKDSCIIRMQISDIELTEQIEIYSTFFFRNNLNSTSLLWFQISPLETFR